ncbi:oxygen-independent coproporphyrinogen-3 oxidase [Modicisalibacter xianhensis]|uniref:Coproporphyrinogen-III oxidase n=1 Tax=Modicisalibacter xianhensis TaxID=442341 RepID=A0A4V3GU52_9GAMM|nr:oxygen-independent coproporphyrinogen III oxidase [Halomonas xianhensis]TDX29438.1 oxygen-independent coproporphyrinogen-3 oxidase [Halomonas xianhensis]
MDRPISFDPALLGKYDQPAPRYVTYPRRARFCEDVSAADYLQAAQASNEDPIPKPLAAYIHVPICHQRCRHCTVDGIVMHESDTTARYLTYLKREIALQGALYDHDRPIERLSIGGGTPTCLSDVQLADLLNTLHRHFGLEKGPSRDVSLQIDPLNIVPERMATLAALGFNRLNFGVRALDPRAQRAIDRSLGVDRLVELVDAARRARFPTLGVDLVLGLPGQTPQGLSAALTVLTELRPERIGFYRHSQAQPERLLASNTGLLSREAALALFGTGVMQLTAAGYVHLGMGQFAWPTDALAVAQRNGKLLRDTEGYTAQADADHVGLGAGAIGHVNGNYYQNALALPRYYARLDAGILPVWRGFELGADDLLRQDVIRRLMGEGQVRFADVERRHRIVFRNYFAPELAALHPLAEDGLVEIQRGALLLTPTGHLLMNRIAMIFDSGLNELQPRRLQMLR